MHSPRVVVFVSAVVAALALLACGGPVAAGSYSITHQFEYMPIGPALPTVHAFGTAWTSVTSGSNPGDDSDRKEGVFGAAGGGFNAHAFCSAGGSRAEAGATWSVESYSREKPVCGTYNVWGDAVADGNMNGSSAFATSRAWGFLEETVSDPTGWIKYGPSAWSAVGSASDVRWRRTFDPLSVALFAPNGDLLYSETLMNVWATIDTDQGTMTWNGGKLTLTAADAEFHIDLGSQYIEPLDGGGINFKVVDGVVTASSAWGVYDYVALPALGTTSNPQGQFTFDISNAPVQIDFDYSSFENELSPGENLTMRFGFESGLGAPATPELSTWALLACTGLFGVGMLRRRRTA